VEHREEQSRINTAEPTKEEIKIALKALRAGRAPGIDNIPAQPEILKVDLETSAEVLPENGRMEKGLLVKIPKMGGGHYSKQQLLSLPSKVLNRILLSRINIVIETRL
jgi:hypothetical protein